MIPEKLPVHINYLTPKPGFRLLREMIGFASGYLGIDEHDLLATIRGRLTDHPIQTGELVNDKFHFGSEKQGLQHFLTAQKTARSVIYSLIENYGLPGRFEQKTEVEIPDPNLGRMLTYTNPRESEKLPKGTILRTRFEVLRELILTDIALRLDQRAVKEEPFKKMSELQLIFNQSLFYGPAGYENLVAKYVTFNKEHGIEKISDNDFEGATKIEEPMRIIEAEDGRKIHVLVDFNKKPASRQITKGLVDHMKVNAEIYDPLGLDSDGKPSLLDRQRFMFMVDGDDKDIAIIHNKIATYFDGVEEKPIHLHNGQNPTLKKRYIASYNGTPIEIIYYDFKGYINSKRHVGNKNQQGMYDGSAHELFEMRRSLPALLYFFPFEVYGRPDQSKEEYRTELINFARFRSEERAKKIRGF